MQHFFLGSVVLLAAGCSMVVEDKLGEKPREGELGQPGGDASADMSADAPGAPGVMQPGPITSADAGMPTTGPEPGTPPSAVKLCAGLKHACALDRASGAVTCWGNNVELESELGKDGTLFQDIACGHHHTCGITREGAVLCKGRNQDGQVTKKPAGAGFAQITAGDRHSCARHEDGQVTCWGSEELGQTQTTKLATLRFRDVAAGERFTCGITTSGAIECWGDSSDQRTRPPTLTKRPVHIAAGGAQGCVIDEDTVVHCWGTGSAKLGQLSRVVELSLGGDESYDVRARTACARTDDGRVFCWRGEGPEELRSGPYAAVGAGPTSTCTLPVRGELRCTADEGYEIVQTAVPMPWPPVR